jgi:hypothetical protein
MSHISGTSCSPSVRHLLRCSRFRSRGSLCSRQRVQRQSVSCLFAICKHTWLSRVGRGWSSPPRSFGVNYVAPPVFRTPRFNARRSRDHIRDCTGVRAWMDPVSRRVVEQEALSRMGAHCSQTVLHLPQLSFPRRGFRSVGRQTGGLELNGATSGGLSLPLRCLAICEQFVEQFVPQSVRIPSPSTSGNVVHHRPTGAGLRRTRAGSTWRLQWPPVHPGSALPPHVLILVGPEADLVQQEIDWPQGALEGCLARLLAPFCEL